MTVVEWFFIFVSVLVLGVVFTLVNETYLFISKNVNMGSVFVIQTAAIILVIVGQIGTYTTGIIWIVESVK